MKAPGEKVPVGELYQSYRGFCAQDAVEARSQREFGQLLRTVFKVEQSRNGSTRYWKGIRLSTDHDTSDTCASMKRIAEPMLD